MTVCEFFFSFFFFETFKRIQLLKSAKSFGETKRSDCKRWTPFRSPTSRLSFQAQALHHQQGIPAPVLWSPGWSKIGQEYYGRRIILWWRTEIRDSAYGDGAGRMWRRRHREMEELDLRSLSLGWDVTVHGRGSDDAMYWPSTLGALSPLPPRGQQASQASHYYAQLSHDDPSNELMA